MTKTRSSFSKTRRGPISRMNMNAKQKYERTLKRRYARSKSRARKSGKAFSLTFKQFESLLAPDECAYCGGELEKSGISLDRINSHYGYTKKNVVACCAKCNKMKSDLTMEQFFKHIERIIKRVKL